MRAKSEGALAVEREVMLEDDAEAADLPLVEAALAQQHPQADALVGLPSAALGVADVVEHRGDSQVAQGSVVEAQGLAQEQGRGW